MKKLKIILCIALVITISVNSNIKANGLLLGATTVSGAGAGNQISFPINWNNSWNAAAPNNWDAVWIFAKYQDCTNPAVWLPVTFSTAAVHTITGGVLQVDPVADGMGVFIRRSALGSGNIAVATATLTITSATGTAYNYRIYGIEMVKIAAEDFQIGDGVSTNTFLNNTVTAATQAAGFAAGALYAGSPVVPNTFPFYNSIYCMKYEVTQHQYVDFLNSLTYTQQAGRTAVFPNLVTNNFVMYAGIARNRNSIKILTSGVSVTTPAVYGCDFNQNGTMDQAADGIPVACNFLSWGDLTAYLDWAGLRPMTDIEYERICRGPVGRTAGEYVWGNVALSDAYYYCSWNGVNNISNNGTISEISGAAAGNCVFGMASYRQCCDRCGSSCNVDNSMQQGPLRVGSCATAGTNRQTSGAAYYGAMDMAGNVWERVVAITAAGVTFNGTLGNGTLAANGDADQATWPAPATAIGSGFRGGNWMDAGTYCRTSDRASAIVIDANRSCTSGGRGVR